jgi:hypothetical protein
MECERFKRLLKSWYIQVQNESLAPARMVDFMENHVTDCSVCLMDPEAKKDIAKIITLILPQDKLRQTAKAAHDDGDDLSDDAEDAVESTDEDVVEDEESVEEEESEDEEDTEADDLDEEPEDDK